jgi:hypothetical protein
VAGKTRERLPRAKSQARHGQFSLAGAQPIVNSSDAKELRKIVY